MMEDPALETRRRALKLALDLSGYSRHDARAILAMADGLIDRFVFPLVGRNDLAIADLETIATCRRRP
jgi:hypothetical protein